MKIKSAKLAFLALLAATLTAVPALSQTTTPSTNAPAVTKPAPAKRGVPFHGKITAVDTNAMTFAVGSQTFEVTSQTRISKLNKPAVLADLAVGDSVRIYYRKDDTGKSIVASVKVVPAKAEAKPDAKPETKPAAPAAQQ